MAYPEPEVGLVISYSYLWSDEAAIGHVEGRKPRPCAIIMAVQQGEGEPPLVAKHLGLDGDSSWIVLDDVNVFSWPGFDLRQIPEQAGCYAYGLLPPRFCKTIVRRFSELRQAEAIVETFRDDDD